MVEPLAQLGYGAQAKAKHAYCSWEPGATQALSIVWAYSVHRAQAPSGGMDRLALTANAK
eukprot:126018-Pelagomonas_calceolata.AAC.1